MAKTKPSPEPGLEAAIEALRAMCGLSGPKCRAALLANWLDLELALAALIDARAVKYTDLDPDRVSDELFGRAHHRDIGGVYHMPPKSQPRCPRRGEIADDEYARLAAAAKQKLAEQGKDFQATGASARPYARIHRRANRLKEHPVAVKLPPLPKLNLTLSEWVGKDTLGAWAGFGEKRGSKGRVEVILHRASGDDDDTNPVKPAPEMVAAYRHMKEHGAELAGAVLAAFQSYLNDTLVGHYGWDLQRVADVDSFKTMLEIQSVYVLRIAKDGLAYLGLSFHCTWDEEHGAASPVHGSRVVEVGQADVAGDDFAAQGDGGRRIVGW